MHRPVRALVRLAALLALSAFGPAAQLQSGVVGAETFSSTEGGFSGPLSDGDFFGRSLADVGDLDGDGATELCVGAPYDDDGGTPSFLLGVGAVWVLFLDADGALAGEQKISATAGSFTGGLDLQDEFGEALVGLGDLDGDGVADLAVGAPGDDDGGTDRGAVWILFLQADGSVKSHQKISATAGGFTGPLADGDGFGRALGTATSLGLGGVRALAVGAPGDDGGGVDRGAVWILSLSASGEVVGSSRIGDGAGGFPAVLADGDRFGAALDSPGDVDGDGVPDLAVGAPGDDDGGSDRGAGWLLFLESGGVVGDDGGTPRTKKLSDASGGFGAGLENGDELGSSVGVPGDVNGDGVPDLVLGARFDDDGGFDRGAIHVVLLEADGTVLGRSTVSQTQGNFPGSLQDSDLFGSSLAARGPVTSGSFQLAVGAPFADDGGLGRGAVWLLHLAPAVPAAAVSRNGSNVNPAGLASTSDPIVGTVWTATLDLATPGADAGALLLGLGGPTSGLVLHTPFLSGELLALPPLLKPTPVTMDGTFALPLPADPSLLGLQLSCQGATVTGGLPLVLQNALDLTVGSFAN